jgi:3-oxoacyl-[acyl-carrier protein] reductase
MRIKPWETLHAMLTRLGTSPLLGQTVLIVGGASGLGLELARGLAGSGCKLALCAADAPAVARARAELEARGAAVIARQCDASQASDIAQLVEAVLHRFGSLDVLITCPEALTTAASTGPARSALEHALSRQLWTAYEASLAVLPHMHERRAGRIVHVCGAAGDALTSSVIRGAMTGLSTGLRRQVAEDHVSVLCIEPADLPRRLARVLANADKTRVRVPFGYDVRRLVGRLWKVAQRMPREVQPAIG